ncbi:Fructose-2-6-bisphosphatase TIGAR-like [Homarus americanus]|uniref:Fructose-2-6-bisphosphatase TIGAR-like n=1 Tax=Homarus americanus TaxID=6706 RepID=A0A8J5JPS7_HOMAM|nr:Fructose-2-6-bisphosphatase TIGAR-like [Homarus americanus]
MSEIVKETPEPKDDTMRRVTPVVFSITFVRHGETKANREQRIQGHLDIPLSSVGEMQASQVGTRLCKADFTRVYASDLCRAYSTCELILKENSCKPPPIKIDTRLRERNFGSVEGMSLDDVKVMAAAEGLTWPDFNPSGSETLGVLQGRMVSFFKPLEEVVPVEKILVVSHGAALKQLYVHLHKTLGCLAQRNMVYTVCEFTTGTTSRIFNEGHAIDAKQRYSKIEACDIVALGVVISVFSILGWVVVPLNSNIQRERESVVSHLSSFLFID